MNGRKNKLNLVFLELMLLASVSVLPLCGSIQKAVFLDASPAEIKNFQIPFKYGIGYFDKDYQIKSKDGELLKRPEIPVEKYFQIEPSDAIDGTKYSQPALDRSKLDSYHHEKVPLTSTLKDLLSTMKSVHSSHKKSSRKHFPLHMGPKDSFRPMKDGRFLEFQNNKNSHVGGSFSGTENVTSGDEISMLLTESPANENSFRIENETTEDEIKRRLMNNQTNQNSFRTENMATEDKLNILTGDIPASENLSSEYFDKKNFTDSSASLLSVSSETVLSYENPSSNFDEVLSRFVVPVKKNSEKASEEDVPSHLEDPKPIYTDTNISTLFPVLPKLTTESSVTLSTHLYIEPINLTSSTEGSVTTTVLPTQYDIENVSSSSPSIDNHSLKLRPGVLVGVVMGVLVCVTVVSSAVIYLLYRRYNGKCTSVVEGKFNSDNCGYLDDSLRSSIYLNNHIELPKESSEEMSSLDNDSFLNSLETMTIQNYWADNSKNTKV